MLEIKNMTVCYSGHAQPAVEQFNLNIKKGDICSIVGESGSGKTTVIRAVLGCLPQSGKITEGDIFFEGKSLMHYDNLQWKTMRGKDMAMIFQDSGAMMNPVRTIGNQYVEYIRAHQKIGKKEAWNMGMDMLQKMQLPECDTIMRSYPFQLSGGMRQRVGIAMAMTFRPKLLLADEPTSALDGTMQAQIVRQMMELRDQFGTSIIIVTHNIGVAAYMGDCVVVMKNGRIMEKGQRDKILCHPESTYTRYLLAAVPTMEGKRYV